LKPLFGAIVLGLILSLATGLVIKPEIGIPEIRHYGYPLFWRETNLMQIAYFEIYPHPAITPEFRLGYAQVEGLTTQFASGLMSLGGSLTTNIASWLIALILLTVSLGYKTQLALKILGLFGFLDLPLYVLFPQLGLPHWIFIGGCTPEPLIGARKMGIPDPIFYTMVILSTLGLVFAYFKPLRDKLWKMTTRIRDLEATFETKVLLRHLFGAAVCGVLVSLATGAIENPPEASIIGARFYGWPLIWRVTMITMNKTTDFKFANLAIDILFWITILFIASVAICRIMAMFGRKSEDSPAA